MAMGSLGWQAGSGPERRDQTSARSAGWMRAHRGGLSSPLHKPLPQLPAAAFAASRATFSSNEVSRCEGTAAHSSCPELHAHGPLSPAPSQLRAPARAPSRASDTSSNPVSQYVVRGIPCTYVLH